jgi:hypothetical protein
MWLLPHDLPGMLLEAMARLFTQNVRVSLYPMVYARVEVTIK